MQFQVPQFIDVAPKIIGPLTIRQFLYVVAGVAPAFILFFMLAFWLWLIITAILLSIAVALAFGKMNGQPLTRIAFAAFSYFWQPRFYLWKRAEEPVELPALPKMPEEASKPRTPIRELAFKIATTTRPIPKREKAGNFFAAFRKRGDDIEVFRKTTGERAAARRVDYR